MMFNKKYFQDRPILFLNLIVILGAIINIFAIALRIDTTQTVTIIRYQVALGLSGFQRANTLQLYGFIFLAILISIFAVFFSAKIYQQRRSLSLMVLSLTIIALLFNLIISNAVLNLQ